ncbi:MAG: AI-2E family transporter [Patescibacteria group bacterium]
MSDLSRDIHINLNTGTIVRFFLFAILLVAAYYISDVLLVVLAAIILASAIEPVIRRLKRHKVHRIISVILIYVIIATVLAGIVVFFMPLVLNEASDFLNGLPSTISLDDIWSPIRDIGISLSSNSPPVVGQTISVAEYVKGFQNLILGTGGGVFKTAGVIFGGFLSLILIIVLSFYLAVKEDGVDDFLRIVTPVKHHNYIIDLWKRSQRKIALWLQGQILLGIVVGVLVYLVLMVVGIKHALLLALFAAILEIIPVFGPMIASVPAILVAFTENGIGTGFLLIGLYLIIYQFESQLFYPLVVKKVVGISPIVVILALVIGAKLAGVLGALIAVPLSAAFMEYIHDIEKYKKVEIAEREAVKNSVQN